MKTFRFIQRQASSDVCDALEQIDKEGQAAEVEYIVKAKRNGFFGKLDALKKEFTKPVPNFKSIVEIPNFDYDTIKVDMEIAGKRRCIDLGNVLKINGTIDITDDVTLDQTGHPRKDSFVSLARGLASTLFEHR